MNSDGTVLTNALPVRKIFINDSTLSNPHPCSLQYDSQVTYMSYTVITGPHTVCNTILILLFPR